MVINLDAPYNVAITHNYVSGSNLDHCLQFLRDKRHQVSGCRDRPHEAIPPERLYEEFVSALQSHAPALLHRTLEAAKNGTAGKKRSADTQQREYDKETSSEPNSSIMAKAKQTNIMAKAKQTNIMAKAKPTKGSESFHFSFF